MIRVLDAARRQLEAAIRLLDAEDLAAHTLAYAAYCLLRDKFGRGEMRNILREIEERFRLREIPEFLKHPNHHPEAILRDHSPKTAHLTIALAIRLWTEHGREETKPMVAFARRPTPYKAGYRHETGLKIITSGDIADAAGITFPSTVGSPIERAPRRRRAPHER